MYKNFSILRLELLSFLVLEFNFVVSEFNFFSFRN